jgi:hypothetical protein
MKVLHLGTLSVVFQRGRQGDVTRELPEFETGDVLILTEVRGSQTGEPEDADPASPRCTPDRVTRMTRWAAITDSPLTALLLITTLRPSPGSSGTRRMHCRSLCAFRLVVAPPTTTM